MRLIFLALIFTFHVTPNALAGAVSAGGMMAPPKFECLFIDPSEVNRPYNFMAFDFGTDADLASLTKVDLVTKQILSSKTYDVPASGDSQTLIAHPKKGTQSESFKIVTDDSRPLKFQDFSPTLQSYSGIPDVSYVEDVVAYPSVLSAGGKTYEGICAKDVLFFYFIDKAK